MKNNIQKNSNRIHWLDIAKGIGIIIVIIIHSYDLRINMWIATVCLPLFFFLSGYTYSTKRDYLSFVIQKARTMLLPYLSIGFLCFLFSTILDIQHGTFQSFPYAFSYFMSKLLIQKRFTALWFITCLLLLELILYPVLKYIKNPFFLLTIGLLSFSLGILYYSLGGAPLLWNIDVCLTASLYFILGYCSKNYLSRTRFFTESVGRKWFIFFLSLLSMSISIIGVWINYKYYGYFSNMFLSSYCYPVVTVVASICGTIFICLVSYLFSPYRCALLSYIGENSMFFFSTHSIIFIPIARTILHKLNLFRVQTTLCDSICYTALTVFIVVVLTCIFNQIICSTKLKILIGK